MVYLVDEQICAVYVDAGVESFNGINTDSIDESNNVARITRCDGVTTWHTDAKLAYSDNL